MRRCQQFMFVPGLLLASWLFPLSISAQQTQPPFLNPQIDSNLESDTRLKQQITLDEVGTPLKDVLKKLSKQGLALTCGSSCAEQKVQIRLKKRPLSVLMQSLAELMPGTWLPLPSKSGYSLNMTDTAVRYRANWWELFLSERDRAIAAQRAHVLAKMRENVIYAEAYEEGSKEISPELAQKETHLHSFYRLLPAVLQEQIAAHMLTNIFYSNNGVSRFPRENETVVSLNELPDAVQRIIREYVPSLQPGEDVPVAFCNAAIAIMPRIIQSGKPMLQANVTLTVGMAPDAVVLEADQPGFVEIVRKRGKLAPVEWQRLAAYQQSRVWKNDIATLEEYHRQPFRRAEVLDWLAEKADLEFVADYYSHTARPLSLQQKMRKLSRTLKAELDYHAAEQDMSWKQRTDGICIIRNNRWYRDDNMEVPARLLQQWEATPLPPLKFEAGHLPANEDLLRRITAQLDREIEFMSSLTLWQISNGLEGYVPEKGSRQFDLEHPAYAWRPFSHIAQHTLTDDSFLQFYIRLTPEMRQELLGGHLSFTALDAVQRQCALYLLPELQLLAAQRPEKPILLDMRAEIPIAESTSGYNSNLEPIRLFNFSLTLAMPNH